ncbi:hypothetical protein [Aliamphritea hakodatensis]|uniref:hypothetical protein n=1 Tax=Aliamphritea hakodatensis TaxID=2895352 RepID=UPI0022FD3988|nr:hypothetical protein [Aliamphritea hakodatensis]
MKPLSNKATQLMLNTSRQRPQLQLTIIVAVCLFLGIFLAGFYLNLVAERVAEQQTHQRGQLLAEQTGALIKPAILANDPVSLNYQLNQLVRQDYIDAISVSTPADKLLARAGNAHRLGTLTRNITITQQGESLANLTLVLNPTEQYLQFRGLLLQALILALIIAIICILLTWQLAARLPATQGSKQLPPAEDDEQQEAFQAQLASHSARHSTPVPAIATPAVADLFEQSGNQTHQPAPPSAPDALVDLLKPDTDTPNIPSFAPSEPLPETPQANTPPAPIIEELEIPQEANIPTVQPPPQEQADNNRPSILKNPLFDQDTGEVQLDLYAFEQELEMIVNAEEAGYLLYLDLTSGHAENLSSAELEQTQDYYTRMLEMVIAIYQGEITRLSNGDLQLAFLRPNPEDAHGINAICASQLFNRLYKAFNQQRIRRMQPILNLHMAIVRGHYKKLPRLQEEARYLTRSTDSNELISHTALSEAPDLKISLLAGADIERSEEDKVLLRAVNESYQKLLDKQAQHLLKKLPF